MMKSAKTHHQDEEEDEYEEFGSKRDAQPSSNANREGKNSDKATATRSKHSVTEQRRRSKINERFQILRDLIPNSDQKRDTASFLLEVIEYVQYLQEKVQKHEGSYQGWSTEPTKLMPWRNSHWRVQSSVGHPQAVKIDSGTAPTFPHHFDDNNMMGSMMHTNPQDHVESGPTQDPSCKLMDQQPDPIKNPTVVPAPSPIITGTPVQLDGTAFSGSLQRPLSNAQHHSADSHVCTNALNQNEDLTVEGGTISISSVYSQGLLNTLTDALQNAGVDLSQATISVQVDLGKRANRGLTANKDSEIPYSSNNHHVEHFQDGNSGEDNEQVHKRMKI